jgi:cytochrome P450
MRGHTLTTHVTQTTEGTQVTGGIDEIVTEIFQSTEGKRNPYPLYRQLHERGQVHRSAQLGWVATGYEVSSAALRDPRVIKGPEQIQPGRPDPAEHSAEALLQGTMHRLDPPDHTRLRRLVNGAFTPRSVAALEPAIQELIDDLIKPALKKAEAGEPVDMMSGFAFPLSVAVIGRMLGVPAADWHRFHDVVLDLSSMVELGFVGDELPKADAAADELIAYFRKLGAERMRRPADDLTSTLANATEAGDRLTEQELVTMLILLFMAGFETTTHSMGNGMFALLENPEQTRWLRRNMDAMPAAVEELIRYDSPVQFITGYTKEPVVLADGTAVPADEYLFLMIGAANRDPRVFTDPDRLRLDRGESAAMSFGGGIHYCLGAGLARLEIRKIFTSLLTHFSKIELADPDPERRSGLALRGYARIPMWLTPAE